MFSPKTGDTGDLGLFTQVLEWNITFPKLLGHSLQKGVSLTKYVNVGNCLRIFQTSSLILMLDIVFDVQKVAKLLKWKEV